MPKFEFEIILSGETEMTENISNALFAAGCDDGTPFSSEGVAAVGFSREADSLKEAVRSAIADVQKSGYSVARVESADETIFTPHQSGTGRLRSSPVVLPLQI
ncbi:MAG: hypothetical protein IID45_00415, partial [Planctomycetes bacterium]|nr:hypothetical protein [Planctomycetota bacterium]